VYPFVLYENLKKTQHFQSISNPFPAFQMESISLDNNGPPLIKLSNRFVFGWGLNKDGQCGIGNLENQNVPARIKNNKGFKGKRIVQISSGGLFSCALSG
jgi:alpha-tubulin suppressor-like RCC1 family protein